MLGKITLRPYETRSFVNVNIIVTFHLKKLLMENYVSRTKCSILWILTQRGFGSSQKNLKEIISIKVVIDFNESKSENIDLHW